jgi:hypothetical protein
LASEVALQRALGGGFLDGSAAAEQTNEKVR